jgi:hypothetical protein
MTSSTSDDNSVLLVHAYLDGELDCRCVRRAAVALSRECTYRVELDVESLVWTRGRDFPINRLAERLRCPRCGSRYVRVLFDPPPASRRASCDVSKRGQED